MSETVFVPSRWIVHVTVTSPLTGEAILAARHSCRDRHHAATLLTEIRELAESLAQFLPGLTATGYELAEAVSIGQSFAGAVVESRLSAADKAHWQGRSKPRPCPYFLSPGGAL